MLARLGNMLVGVGRNAEADQYLGQAIALLEAHPPGPELSYAYRMRSALTFLDHDYQGGIVWSEKAIAISEALNDTGAILASRNMVGSSLLFLDFEDGCRYMLANMTQARDGGFGPTAAHAYANLGSASSELFHLRRAERYLREGIAFAAERDFDRYLFYMTAWLAVTCLRLGRWEEAEAAADTVLRRPGVSVPSRITALAALGTLRARRGDPGAAESLDEALELIRELSNLHRVGLVRAARAEAAWLAGDMAGASAEAAAAYELARDKRHPWFAGELALWLHRADQAVDAPDWLAEPCLAEMNGNWRAAAAAWERLRCPYECALALAGGDQPAQLEALRRLEALGARPAAALVRQRLRDAGASGIPRGPRPATRRHPYGLTNRQMEIAVLLAEGLTNTQIAARLQISPKTVDHHVSAVLAKLDVRTREEAAALARGWQG
jgi:DNA-binding CsgD family transcriptional regulator